MNRREIYKSKVALNKNPTSSVARKWTVWSIDDLDVAKINTSDIPEWTKENWTRAKLGNIHGPCKVNQ